MNRPSWEVLIGNPKLLDYLASKQPDAEEHPLQRLIEDTIANLDEEDQEVFFLRYGEQLSIRDIAKRLGYLGHRTIQLKLERIESKVREAVERTVN